MLGTKTRHLLTDLPVDLAGAAVVLGLVVVEEGEGEKVGTSTNHQVKLEKPHLGSSGSLE
jgi:hypothetical protein